MGSRTLTNTTTNKMKQKVLKVLKTKVSSLGFNEEELNEVAVSIASNLADDATDEQIESGVNGVIPFLKLSQKTANRIVSKNQKEMEDMKKQLEESKIKTAGEEENGKEKKGEDMPAWFKKFQEDTEKRFAEMQAQSVGKTRKEQISSLLKEKGAFGASKMRDFERMNFKDDADFESYLSSIKEDIESYDKEVSSAKANIKPIGGSGNNKEITDKEIDNIVSLL